MAPSVHARFFRGVQVLDQQNQAVEQRIKAADAGIEAAAVEMKRASDKHEQVSTPPLPTPFHLLPADSPRIDPLNSSASSSCRSVRVSCSLHFSSGVCLLAPMRLVARSLGSYFAAASCLLHLLRLTSPCCGLGVRHSRTCARSWLRCGPAVRSYASSWRPPSECRRMRSEWPKTSENWAEESGAGAGGKGWGGVDEWGGRRWGKKGGERKRCAGTARCDRATSSPASSSRRGKECLGDNDKGVQTRKAVLDLEHSAANCSPARPTIPKELATLREAAARLQERLNEAQPYRAEVERLKAEVGLEGEGEGRGGRKLWWRTRNERGTRRGAVCERRHSLLSCVGRLLPSSRQPHHRTRCPRRKPCWHSCLRIMPSSLRSAPRTCFSPTPTPYPSTFSEC